MDDITIAICNYNTTALTNNCIKSILQKSCLSRTKFVILDNSDKEPFSLYEDTANIKIIDNTAQQFINFDFILENSPYKLMSFNGNNYGSLKHAYSIQFLLNICTTQFMLLFDSDIRLKRKIDFIDEKAVTVGDIEVNGETDRTGHRIYTSKTRFLPFIQLFNLELIKQNSLFYFDFRRMHGILAPHKGNYYDTGAAFFEDVERRKLKWNRIYHNDYIDHIDHGSWRSR